MVTVYVADQLHEYNPEKHQDILQVVPKYELDEAQAEIARLKEDRDRWKRHYELANDTRAYAITELHKAESALDVAVEGLEYYKNHKSVIDEAYQTETKQLVVVHTFINHHAREALDKIKKIRE